MDICTNVQCLIVQFVRFTNKKIDKCYKTKLLHPKERYPQVCKPNIALTKAELAPVNVHHSKETPPIPLNCLSIMSIQSVVSFKPLIVEKFSLDKCLLFKLALCGTYLHS